MSTFEAVTRFSLYLALCFVVIVAGVLVCAIIADRLHTRRTDRETTAAAERITAQLEALRQGQQRQREANLVALTDDVVASAEHIANRRRKS